MRKNDLLKARGFLESLRGKCLVAYHSDMDGVVSASILLKYFEEKGFREYESIPLAVETHERVLKRAKNFDYVIILDVDLSFMKEKLVSLGKRMLIVDHHPPRQDLNSRNILYINPRLQKDVYQPVSYLMYKLLRKLMKKDVSWLAAIGTVADYGFEDCMDLLKKFVRTRKKENLWKTKMGKLVIKLNGALAILGFEKFLNILVNSGNLKELETNLAIQKASEEYFKIYENCKKVFWRNARIYEDVGLIVSFLPVRKRVISSSLATEISVKNPKKVIVIYRKIDGKCVVSARYQGKDIDLGKLMEKCAKGLNGGGGHRNAAGATLRWEKRKIFEERLVEFLRVHRKHRK